MAETNRDRADIVFTRLARFNATVQGLTCGILLGGAIFHATNSFISRAAKLSAPISR
jgi:hypothetical protein